VPQRPRYGYAAVFPRSLPGSMCQPPREFPARHEEQVRAAPGPDPPGFGPVSHKGAVSHRFLAYSSSSRSPDPAHLAVLDRPGFVRAAPALPGTTRIRLPSAPPPCCDKDSGEGLPPPLEPQRLTAHPLTAPPLRLHRPRRRASRSPRCPAGSATRASRSPIRSMATSCPVPSTGPAPRSTLPTRKAEGSSHPESGAESVLTSRRKHAVDLRKLPAGPKITQIYEGTNQIQHVVMARQLLRS
jgi:hypothetical protein